jgi:hypothetical protein
MQVAAYHHKIFSREYCLCLIILFLVSGDPDMYTIYLIMQIQHYRKSTTLPCQKLVVVNGQQQMSFQTHLLHQITG